MQKYITPQRLHTMIEDHRLPQSLWLLNTMYMHCVYMGEWGIEIVFFKTLRLELAASKTFGTCL